MNPSPRRFVALVAVSLVLTALPGRAAAGDTWTKPYTGVDYLLRTTAVPQRIHALKVDLTRADLRLRATRSAERGKRTSSWASARGCEAAINADYFTYGSYDPSGLAVGDGKPWPDGVDTAGQGFLAAGKDNRVEISKPSAVVTNLPAWYWDVVGGRNGLVFDGVRKDYPNCVSDAHCVRHPRTAVGVDKTGDVLFLVVVDGRTSSSKGMDLNELGKLMLNLGAERALNLDGGGSSTMWIKNKGGVVNAPSDDGVERVVANHFCVDKVQPLGDLEGTVQEAGTSKPLKGAVVTLPSGKKATTNAQGVYSFQGIGAGTKVIQASHEGHESAEKTAWIVAQDVTAVSFKLKPVAAGSTTSSSTSAATASSSSGGGAGGAGAGGIGGGGAEPGEVGAGAGAASSAAGQGAASAGSNGGAGGASTDGAGGSAGSAGPEDAAAESGCGCKVVGARAFGAGPGAAGLLVAAAVAAARRHRRERGPRRSRP